MSLKKVVLEMADRVSRLLRELRADSIDEEELDTTLIEIAAGLRAAADATSEPSAQVGELLPHYASASYAARPMPVPDAYENAGMDAWPPTMRQERARVVREVQAQGRKADTQEKLGPVVAVCEDGPEEGTHVPLDPFMPTGAYCLVGPSRYRLEKEGGKGVLRHRPPEVSV